MKQVLQMEHNMVENSNLAKEFELKNKSSKKSGGTALTFSTTLPPLIISSRRSQWLRYSCFQIFNTLLQYVTVDSLTNHMTNQSCCKKNEYNSKRETASSLLRTWFYDPPPPSPPPPLNSWLLSSYSTHTVIICIVTKVIWLYLQYM